jgi:hypothetical protein
MPGWLDELDGKFCPFAACGRPRLIWVITGSFAATAASHRAGSSCLDTATNPGPSGSLTQMLCGMKLGGLRQPRGHTGRGAARRPRHRVLAGPAQVDPAAYRVVNDAGHRTVEPG